MFLATQGCCFDLIIGSVTGVKPLCNVGLLKIIQRAEPVVLAKFFYNMGINHGCFYAFVSQKLLNSSDVYASL